MLGWDWHRYDKKRAETCYAKLVFLYPMRYVGHVVHSGASDARNVDALFLMLGWDRYRCDKKRAETHYAKIVFSHPVGYAGHVLHSHASRAQNVDTLFFMLRWHRYGYDKKRGGTLHRACVFAFGRICESRSAFRCILGAKCRRIIFYARVGPVWIP
jgi:hypothetical protein